MSERLHHLPGYRIRIRDVINKTFWRGMCHPLALAIVFGTMMLIRMSDALPVRLFAGCVFVWIMLVVGVPLTCLGIVFDKRYPLGDVLKASMLAGVWALFICGIGFCLRAHYWDHQAFSRAWSDQIDVSFVAGGVGAGFCFLFALFFRFCSTQPRF
jgi:hypothetical protein